MGFFSKWSVHQRDDAVAGAGAGVFAALAGADAGAGAGAGAGAAAGRCGMFIVLPAAADPVIGRGAPGAVRGALPPMFGG